MTSHREPSSRAVIRHHESKTRKGQSALENCVSPGGLARKTGRRAQYSFVPLSARFLPRVPRRCLFLLRHDGAALVAGWGVPRALVRHRFSIHRRRPHGFLPVAGCRLSRLRSSGAPFVKLASAGRLIAGVKPSKGCLTNDGKFRREPPNLGARGKYVAS